MLNSAIKADVIERHKTNELLQAPLQTAMQRNENDLSVDQPNNQPDSSIIEAAGKALEEGNTHYVDVPGIAPLREALTKYLESVGVQGYEPQNVLVTAGIQESRFLSIQMLGELFESVAIPSVVDPGVKKALGVRPIDQHRIPVDEANGFLPTISGIKEALEKGCSLIYLESPSRLTGASFSAEDLKEIADLVREHDAAVIWDQGLLPWVDETQSPSLASQSGMKHRVALIGEAFPGVGLESWFIGYIAVNAEWLERMRSQKQIMAICTSTPSQFAALKAAEIYPQFRNQSRSTLSDLRNSGLQDGGAGAVEVLPGQAANLVAFRISNAGDAAAKLSQAGFDVAQGEAFGAPNVLRISIVAGNNHTEAFKVLTQSQN
jgi:aminotransferase